MHSGDLHLEECTEVLDSCRNTFPYNNSVATRIDKVEPRNFGGFILRKGNCGITHQSF